MRQIIIILHDIRSSHNVGALLRTADGLGVEKVFMTGYTSFPQTKDDKRLPHLAAKIGKQIDKTALGAAQSVNWKHNNNVKDVINSLKKSGYLVAALEQDEKSIPLPSFEPPKKLVLLLGNEVDGVAEELMKLVDIKIEIPMFGKKESYNVAAAAAMAVYHCRFYGSTD